MKTSAERFVEFLEIIERLRDPQTGCPWDIEQTHKSLKQYLIEESYEVVESIDEYPEHLPVELGDVLLQIVLHSQIGKEAGTFSIDDVLESISKKMIERHPHVFGDRSVADAEEVVTNWEAIKRAERGENASVIDGVPKALPALQRAQRIGDKASRIGFDWDHSSAVLDKVQEEVDELKQAFASGNGAEIAEELGDLLFSLAQFSRKAGFVAEEALHAAVEKFSKRFRKLEQACGGKELSADELNELWEAAKTSA